MEAIIMKTLLKEQIISATKAIRGGSIARITYKTEVPIKSEFKKQGYKIIKIVETSVRFGVNYHNIASVIERKSNLEYVPTLRKNNYTWVVKNRIKHNDQTNKDYLVVATLPVGHNTKVKYLIEGTFVGTIDMGDSIDSHYQHIVLDSYFKKSSEMREIKNISFENIITINKIGTKLNF